MTFLRERAVTRKLPGSRVAYKRQLLSGNERTIEWYVQRAAPPIKWNPFLLPAASDCDPDDYHEHSHDFRDGKRLTKQEDTQNQHKDESQAHKRVGIAQFELGHGGKPAQ